MLVWYVFTNHSKSSSKTVISKPTHNSTKKIEPASTTMVLEPSMQFIQSLPIKSFNTEAIQELSLPKKVLPIKNQTPENVTTTIKPPVQPITPPPTPITSQEKQFNNIGIKRDTNTFNISEIETRFKNNANPHLGLYIARYHYDHGNYNEAYNYALKTNAINNSIEESWMIFAKSLIKMGKTEQAKKTLQIYLNQTNSESAKTLLESITNEASK